MKLAELLSLFLLFLILIACSSNPKPRVTPETHKEESPPEPVTLKIYPPSSVAGARGATVSISYTIARHPGNRSFWLSWSDEISEMGGKGQSLAGANETYAFPPILINNLYQGDYTVRLTLTRVENGEEKKHITIAIFSIY